MIYDDKPKTQILPKFYKTLIIRLLLTIVFLLPLWGLGGFGGLVFAQNKAALDSLNRLLKASKPDTNRVNILRALGSAYVYSQVDTAALYNQRALKLAQELKFTKGESSALAGLSFNEMNRGNYVEALDYAQQRLALVNQSNDLTIKGGAYLNLADAYGSMGNWEEALTFYQEAEKIFLPSKDQRKLAVIYGNAGDTYRDAAYFHPAQADSLLRLALPYYFKAIAINRASKNVTNMGTMLSSLAQIYEQLNQDSLALTYLPEAEKITTEVNNQRELMLIKYIRAAIAFKRGQFAEAEKLALAAMARDKAIFGEATTEDIYKLLTKIYHQKKDYAQAYAYQVVFRELREKRLNSPSAQKAAKKIRQRLQEEKHLAELAEVEKEKQIQQLYWLLVGIGFLLVLVVLGITYRNNLRQKRGNRQLHEKNEEVIQQSEELQQQAEELATQRDNLQKANENVVLLSEIGKEITASLKVEQIIETVYEKVNALMDATVFMIGIYNEAKQQIEMPILKEKGETHPFIAYHLSETERPAVWCFSQQKELVWNDVYADYPKVFAGKTLPPVKSGDQTNSLIYMPLWTKDKVIGVISVQSFKKDAYSDYQVHMLRNIAIYTAIAVENAENLIQLDAEKKNLESTNQELEALTEELRQQSDTVVAQRDDLMEKTHELEAVQTTKDLMISAVNHDLRNPLNPILNYSQADYPKLSEAARLALIHQRAKVMFALIDDIMDVYRADKLAINPLPNSLYNTANEAITVISETKKDLPLIENQVPESAMALFEYKYIERVLENLLSNAVKYTSSAENGGKIVITASPLAPEGGTLISSKENTLNMPSLGTGGLGFWRIAITDNGQGIPQDKFEEIFLPFSNPDAKSLGAAKSVGIGLTFCKTKVEAHHSRIGIESEVGKGSTFYFDLLEAPQTATSNDKKPEIQINNLILSNEDKIHLQSHLIDLQAFTNNLGDRKLRKLLNSLDGNENIDTWKSALNEAIAQLDEARYTELLTMIN